VKLAIYANERGALPVGNLGRLPAMLHFPAFFFSSRIVILFVVLASK
jgi:hypothetical protein